MYFASTGRPPNGEEPRKMIPVKDTETKRNPAKLENKLKQKYTFVVEHEDYQMLFSCKNSKERDLWLSALQDGAAGTEAEHERVSLRNKRFSIVEERMSVIESPVGTEEFVREAFKSYVQGSGDGVLRISDLHDLFRHLGHSYSARQLEEIIKDLDPRRTKNISEDAFVEWWLENSDSTIGDSEAGGLEDWDEANIAPQEARSTTMINEAYSPPGLLKLNKKVLEDKLQPFDDSDMDWNHQYQTLLEAKDENSETSVRKGLLLTSFVGSFLQTAVEACKTIVVEFGLPEALKTVKPLSLSDTSSAQNTEQVYLHKGLLFRIAQQAYGADGTPDEHQDRRAAAATDYMHRKIAGHEVRAVNWLQGACSQARDAAEGGKEPGKTDPTLHTVLTCLVDYMGFRVYVTCIPPVDGERTLVFGLTEGGRKMVEKMPEARNQLDAVGQIMNLQPCAHLLPQDLGAEDLATAAAEKRPDEEDGDRRATLPIGIDVQVHRGDDKRLYVLNVSNIFPPDLPAPNTNQMITNKMRPELVEHSATPLTSDAYRPHNSTSDMDRHADDTKCMQTSLFLLREQTHRLASKLDSLTVFVYDSHTLTTVMHRFGFNIRHLGSVYAACTSPHVRTLILTEAIGRVCKHLLAQTLRRAARKHHVAMAALAQSVEPSQFEAPQAGAGQAAAIVESIVAENAKHQERVSALTTEFLNVVVGSSTESDAFWSQVLPPAIHEKFGPCFEYASFKACVHLPQLLLALQYHCGVRLRDTDEFNLKSPTPLSTDDVESVALPSWTPNTKMECYRLAHLADVYVGKGYYEQAFQAFDIQRRLDENAYGDLAIGHTQRGLLLHKIAQCYMRQGDLPAAIEHAKAAFHSVPTYSAFGARIHIMIMRLYFSQRQVDDAMATFGMAHRAILWSVGEHHPLYGNLFAVVADMYYEHNSLGDAIDALNKACHTIDKILGSSHLLSTALSAKLGTLISVLGDSNQALQLYERVLGAYDKAIKHGVNAELELAAVEASLAAMHAKGKDLRHALEYAQKCMQRREAKLPFDHDDLLASYRQLAVMYEHNEDYAHAVVYLEKVYLAQKRKKDGQEAVSDIQHLLVNIWKLKLKLVVEPQAYALLQQCAEMWDPEEIMTLNMPTVVQGTSRQPPADYFDELVEGALPVLTAMHTTEDHEEKQRIIDETPGSMETLGQLSCVMILCS
mmetsp:Transcript_93787/g.268453  ORF Transcript_93787/g.268453 Transcript_93787/m.268453 type:complete len:1190 (-) Transcript_93787:209-3778(-)